MTSAVNKELINALTHCSNACNHCTTACLDEDDVKMMTACIKLTIDCAAICSVTASLIARGSVHGKHLIKECFEVCGICAAECEKHASIAHCVACAALCRTCEKACDAA